jgi:hypothetical protein
LGARGRAEAIEEFHVPVAGQGHQFVTSGQRLDTRARGAAEHQHP